MAIAASDHPSSHGRAELCHLTELEDVNTRRKNAHSLLETVQRRIRFADSLIVLGSVFLAQLVRFGVTDQSFRIYDSTLSYTALSGMLAAGWVVALHVTQSTDSRILGEGAAEYTRVLHATFGLFGTVAILSAVVNLSLARGYLAVAFPLGLISLLANRRFWRHYTAIQRRRGRFQRRVIIVGGSTLIELLSTLRQSRDSTWNVVGICRTDGLSTGEDLGLANPSTPVVSSWRDVRKLVLATEADTVAVSGAHSIGLFGMRELSWDLEGLGVDLVVAPGIMDVAGPRMHLRPVAGLPLLHVDKPTYSGAHKLTKVLLDKLGASILLVFASPVLVICALAVRLSSRGPIFYTSERIGLSNEPFRMIKFRSMVDGADTARAALETMNESDGGVLFKMRDDPRVTAVGRILRRFSLDELPQLFNVIRGDMSLVGPRPPLRDEVEKYSGLVSRRMLVRPGMTGLWQVSGRSNLSWDQSVRLDLTYVENWSLMQDLQILWRTARAVIGSDGAY